MRVIAIIQARLGSTRLPRKVLADICGHPMLWHVVTRAQRIEGVDEVVVSTPYQDRDKIEWALFREGVHLPVIGGPHPDLLKSYADIAKAYRADTVMRITGDNPLLNAELAGEMVTEFRPLDVDYYSNMYPVQTFPDGWDVEIFRQSSLEKANEGARSSYDREHVTVWLRKHCSTAARLSDIDLTHKRITVDTSYDLRYMRTVAMPWLSKGGSLEAMPRGRRFRLEGFWPRIDRAEECWMWSGARWSDGYGRFGREHGSGRVHRIVWEFNYGPIKEGMCVCHRCDTPLCVRVSHLFLGTPKDNAKDCSAKGRSYFNGCWANCGASRSRETHISGGRESMNYATSDNWHARALKVTPGGSQTRSKQRKQFGERFPAAIEYGYESQIRTIDGQEMVDWNGALGAVILGHNHPVVNDAIRNQLKSGILFSLPGALELDVSEQACAFWGWPEMIRWVKTGSEATEAAVRIARCATGRDKIISIGYHGWHSQWHEEADGVPCGSLDDMYCYSWGEILRRIQDGCSCGHDCAAIIVETQWPLPEGTLQNIRKWCTDTGTLLICDEVFQGLRLHKNGWHGLEGVEPDLACFGKALGNGVPVACVVGKRDIMKHAEWVSGTFSGDLLGLAAAQAVMEVYEREKVCLRLWDTGRHLHAQLTAERGPIIEGWLPHLRISFDSTENKLKRYVQGMAERGHLINPGGINIMAAHTEADVKSFIAASREVLGGA